MTPTEREVLADVRADATRCRGSTDDELARLLDQIERRVKELLDVEARRYVAGLTVWKANNAHCAMVIDQQAERIRELEMALTLYRDASANARGALAEIPTNQETCRG